MDGGATGRRGLCPLPSTAATLLDCQGRRSLAAEGVLRPSCSVPGNFGGGGGDVEAVGHSASAGRYPTGADLKREGGGNYGDFSLASRTVDFSAAQVFDDLSPDPDVFVDFRDDVLADLPTVRSTKDTEEVAHFLTINLSRPADSVAQPLHGAMEPEAVWWADVVARSQRHLATRIFDLVMDALYRVRPGRPGA